MSRWLTGFVLLGLWWPAVAAAEPPSQTLAAQEEPTSVTAYRGLAVWSAWDAASRSYRLVGSHNGGPAFALAVRTRTVPFDVDLGPDRRGRPVAVYSRCRREPPGAGLRGVQVGLPLYARGFGCDVWRYDFSREREHRLHGASERAVSEYLPSIWRARVVFARIDSRLPRVRGVHPQLAVLRLGRERRLQRLRGGRTGFYIAPNPRRNSADGGPGLTGIDLYGDRLAFTWDSAADTCKNPDPFGKEDPVISELWLQRLDGTRRRLRRGCSFDPSNFLHSPSFAAGKLSWVTAGAPDSATPPRRFQTLTLASGRVTAEPVPSCLTSMVRSTEAIYASREAVCSPESSEPGRYEVSRRPFE